MKPLIIVCKCGTSEAQKIKRFGEWIVPDSGQKIAMNSGTYKKQYENCNACKIVPGTSNRLLPVQEV
jgi:hypothetical protein